MKKLLLALALTAVTIGVQATENKQATAKSGGTASCTAKTASACCSKAACTKIMSPKAAEQARQ